MNILRIMGKRGISILAEMGRMFMFLLNSLYTAFKPPFKMRLLLRQIRFLGNKSLLVILLTGAFTGMVLALQLFYILQKFGSIALLGPGIALSLIRELGPVLCALMITGRAGSALTKDRKWEVYDIVIEGVSLVNNYRSQFNQIIRSGSYEELVIKLKEKALK